MRIVLDSSILIDHLRHESMVYQGFVERFGLGLVEILIPTVVVMELWSGNSTKKAEAAKDVAELYEHFQVTTLSVDIARVAGILRRDNGLQAVDAIIAATALAYKAELVTLNHKHFEGIRDLKLWSEVAP